MKFKDTILIASKLNMWISHYTNTPFRNFCKTQA